MRWLQRGPGKVQADPERQRALHHHVRQQFGGQVQVRFPEQVRAIVPLFDDDDGLSVAIAIVREYADAGYGALFRRLTEMYPGQVIPIERLNYRPIWQAVAPYLRWEPRALAPGLHPNVQVAAAVTAVGVHSRRVIVMTDPYPLLAGLFEILDLTVANWEFARARVDTDGVALVAGLIEAARSLRDALGDPPPLPPPVRELMRRNNTIDVLDPYADQVVGGFNPGKTMRESLLA